eukprot:1057602-Pelagomonas_calceolata.AAC.2
MEGRSSHATKAQAPLWAASCTCLWQRNQAVDPSWTHDTMDEPMVRQAALKGIKKTGLVYSPGVWVRGWGWGCLGPP